MKHTLRQLAKHRDFTLLAVLIVALGIGAATTMFSTVNALILRPLALPEPDRVVAAYETNLARNQPFFSISVPNYVDWRDRAQSWTSLAALDWRSMNLTGQGEPEVVATRAITANFLPTFGVAMKLGRNFLAEEDRPGGTPVAIISEPFWQRRFAGAPDIIGRTLTFDGTPYTIVGVIARDQFLPTQLEVAVPLATDAAKEDRMNHYLAVYGRLKPGVTLEQADAELKAIAAQIWVEHPGMDRGWSTTLMPFSHEVVGDGLRRALYLLLGAVGLLLLLACANLSNLILVRVTARSHELAVRTALGAGRWQMIRLVVLESLVLTAAGGLLGLLVSLWAVDAMHALPLPRAGEISVDFRVLASACAATLLAGVLASLGPALRASRALPHDALKSRSLSAGQRSRLRDTLVVVQLAISLTLLTGAVLLGRSFVRLLQVNPGFNYENTLAVSLRPTGEAALFYEQLTARLARLPGVTAAGVISALPLTEGNTSLNVFARGPSNLPAGESLQASWRLIDGGYFEAMKIPLLRGRTFATLPPGEAHSAVIISASLARQLWGDADPIGRQLDPGGNGRFSTVIGVVGDVRSLKLGTEPVATFYWSMHRFIYGPMHVVVHSTGELAPLLPAIRAAVKEIDPTVPVFRVRTLETVRAASLEQERLILGLLGGFTAVALLLAALGTYGVIAFSVQQRTSEIGVRRALGAQARDILRLVLGQGARLVLPGIALGIAGAVAASRLFDAMLFSVGATDPLSYALAAATLMIVAVGAAVIPARRALQVSPLTALRSE